MKRFFGGMVAACLAFGLTTVAQAQDEVRGLYKAVLQHEGTQFYQFARITLRTVQVGSNLKVSANVRVLFGDWDSTEYLTYDYDDVPLNLVTRQLSITNERNDVGMSGFLRTGVIEGEWFSSLVGRVGTFRAQKIGTPEAPASGVLVKTLSGYYRGSLVNTNPLSNLPERVTASFVTTQEITPEGPVLKITGSARFYLGPFEGLEYVETRFENIQFNSYNRFLSAKTADYGVTFRGYMTHDGKLDGIVLSDGLGEVGKISVARYP